MKFAAALVATPLLLASVFAPLAGAQPLSGSGTQKYQACLDMIEADPAAAYEEGMAWSSLSGEVGGFRCAAMALAAQGRTLEAARRLENLAFSLPVEAVGLRAELMAQAGNAWLLERDATQARSAFSQALASVQNSDAAPEDVAELLIDRARAYGMERDWRASEEDLSRALDLDGENVLALQLRSYARMQQSAFDLAEADALAAVALEPDNVDSLLMLGHAREAKRTGQPIVEP